MVSCHDLPLHENTSSAAIFDMFLAQYRQDCNFFLILLPYDSISSLCVPCILDAFFSIADNTLFPSPKEIRCPASAIDKSCFPFVVAAFVKREKKSPLLFAVIQIVKGEYSTRYHLFCFRIYDPFLFVSLTEQPGNS